MKLVMTLLVRDEEDILEANIEYHLAQGVDFIVATDNLSVDRTGDILREYERRGVLHYLYEAEDNYNQHAWVTRMARMACADFGADWVLNNDADEFWWPEHGNLKDVLSAQDPSIDGLSVTRSNFVFRGDAANETFWQRQVFREVSSKNHFGHPLPPKVCHRADPGIQVRQGNHSVFIAERELRVAPSGDLIIFHFPIHGSATFRNKIMLGGRAYDRNEELRNKVGKFWLQTYQKSVEDPGYLARYLDRQTVNDAELARHLASGDVMKDTRLRDFMAALDSGRRA